MGRTGWVIWKGIWGFCCMASINWSGCNDVLFVDELTSLGKGKGGWCKEGLLDGWPQAAWIRLSFLNSSDETFQAGSRLCALSFLYGLSLLFDCGDGGNNVCDRIPCHTVGDGWFLGNKLNLLLVTTYSYYTLPYTYSYTALGRLLWLCTTVPYRNQRLGIKA